MVDSQSMEEEQHQQVKEKATPKKLGYGGFDKDALDMLETKNFSDRFSLESSGTSDTRGKICSSGKSQKDLFKSKTLSHLRRSKRLEDQNKTKERVRRGRSKSQGRKSDYQEASSGFDDEENFKDTYEDQNSPYKRPKPTPFTQRITRFKYHRRDKFPKNIKVYEGHSHPELAKKLNDKIPKMVDEMFERVRAFIQGEMAASLAKMVWSPHWDKGNARSIKKWIEEAVASGKLSHLVKDIRQRRGGVKVINMVNARASRKRPYEREMSGLTNKFTFPTIPQNHLMDEPIILEGMIEGHQVRRIRIDEGSSSKIMYEHCFKNFSANVRSRLKN
ncbi:hypothetical protein Tco_0898249 [Tanacetum coccineum]